MTENAANLELAADIVSAYVSNNSLPALELPAFIHSVHGALVGLATGQVAAAEAAPRKEPAVPVKKSVTPDFIICLEDGKKFKSLNSPVKMSRFDQATSRVTATIRAAVSTSDAAMITKAIVSAA